MKENELKDVLKYLSEVFSLLPKPTVDGQIFEPLISYIKSLPTEITNSDIFIKAESIGPTTQYEEVQWITSPDITYINTEQPDKYIQECLDTSTYIGKYIHDIVMDDSIGDRESIVVILSVFESYIHSKTEFDHGMGIKGKFLEAVKKDVKYSVETIALAVTYAIVKIVYANTNGESFDKRLPHRNDILHNGTLSYSDDEVKAAYNMLLSFICIIDDLFEKTH